MSFGIIKRFTMFTCSCKSTLLKQCFGSVLLLGMIIPKYYTNRAKYKSYVYIFVKKMFVT